MAAMVAFFTSFCAVRKKSTSPTTTPEDKSESNDLDSTNDQFAIAPDTRDENEDEEKSSLPLPPGMMNPAGSVPPPNFKKMRTKSLASISLSSSKRHILHSASKKQVLTSISMKVMQAKREKEFKSEDSLWKKRIILGEKCRVFHDDDADADENGNLVPTYYRKVSCSVPVSRQSSFKDEDDIPSVSINKEHAKREGVKED